MLGFSLGPPLPYSALPGTAIDVYLEPFRGVALIKFLVFSLQDLLFIPLQPPPQPRPASRLYAILTPAWNPHCTESSLRLTLSVQFPLDEPFSWESFPLCLSWPRVSPVLLIFFILWLIFSCVLRGSSPCASPLKVVLIFNPYFGQLHPIHPSKTALSGPHAIHAHST